MPEVASNGQAVLHLEIELPREEPGKIIVVLHAETQPAKRGSYMNGELAADGKEQNTARAVCWKN